jgi:hypothetical protein
VTNGKLCWSNYYKSSNGGTTTDKGLKFYNKKYFIVITKHNIGKKQRWLTVTSLATQEFEEILPIWLQEADSKVLVIKAFNTITYINPDPIILILFSGQLYINIQHRCKKKPTLSLSSKKYLIKGSAPTRRVKRRNLSSEADSISFSQRFFLQHSFPTLTGSLTPFWTICLQSPLFSKSALVQAMS